MESHHGQAIDGGIALIVAWIVKGVNGEEGYLW